MIAFEQKREMPGTAAKSSKTTLVVSVIVAAGALLLVLANIHLVYVAIRSQPECVAHLKRGEEASGNGLLSAAKPAC